MDKVKALLASAAVRTVLIGVGVAALESLVGYLKSDTTPTIAEAYHAVGAGAVGAFLFWLRGPQAPKA